MLATFRYDSAHYLISTMELPLIGEAVEASPRRPYLGFRLLLDRSVVTSVMVESGVVQARAKQKDGDEKLAKAGFHPVKSK